MAASKYISPFAPTSLPIVPAIEGVAFATAAAGIRYKGRTDLLVAVLPEGTVAAGVTTTSKTCSAPVLWCRQQLQGGRARILVVNSGNANAFTGKRGEQAVRITADGAANAAGCATSEVYLASTGVIGEPMDAAKFVGLLPRLVASASPSAWHDAAQAIMTTDTFPKLACRQYPVDGGTTTIAGFAKGAGMIAPDMATMLCFLFTDAAISQPLLQQTVTELTTDTFNAVTIDGDTSTSDTLIAFATGKAAAPEISSPSQPQYEAFRTALHSVMLDLALQVVKDGEGLSKFVRINVQGAESKAAARRIGFAIANSPLIKTAFAGEDANWGRVVMAVGKSGEAADRDKLSIWFGPHLLATNGERAPGYDEATVSAYMKQAELELKVDVGVGAASATVWTCDLTREYVAINADYRS